MGVIARGVRFLHPNGAICGTPVNAVLHVRVFRFPPMFGTRYQNGLIGTGDGGMGDKEGRVKEFLAVGFLLLPNELTEAFVGLAVI